MDINGELWTEEHERVLASVCLSCVNEHGEERCRMKRTCTRCLAVLKCEDMVFSRTPIQMCQVCANRCEGRYHDEKDEKRTGNQVGVHTHCA